MAGVCKELRVPRGDPEESAAGYISWLNRACAQLEGIGKRIDEALKQECRRASRYAGGHVLACIRDHRPQLHLEFLREGFSRSQRTPAEIDGLAQSMVPLAEKSLYIENMEMVKDKLSMFNILLCIPLLHTNILYAYI
uniref:Gypsy-type retrotransposon protein n=2 Tax=Oryza sativa subsp. japonica TaxID=39947 RepID=A0A5S6RC99_ORYSJ|nr:Putative Gypsy-type retrotransposon protein [Oryza sativa Japonica Group]AAM08729.1 Putative Gypsy-type retrotransposon protein [Oryza sativa Japonica Group]AAP51918.1 hypothetical protein LOC_Os10g03190 [Oryza sativa Japonica Group]